MSYFDKLPKVFYNNAAARNLAARPFIRSDVLNNTSLYYPYEIKEGDRPDITSQKLYQTPFYDWLVYLSNNVSDPYSDWYMSQSQFEDYIKQKYGSIENAHDKIKFYRVNWLQDDSSLTISGYQQLNTSLKKYWTPIVDENTSRIIKYTRKQIDFIQNTNLIAELSIYGVRGTGFIVGEKIYQTNGTKGFVVHSSNTSLTINNVSGAFSMSLDIVGKESGTVCRHDVYTTLQTNIAAEEANYWIPISFYDFENENNEQKRTIRVLSPRYSTLAENELQSLMGSI